MKIKKMVGAVALTAALAMGSVPAFAASVDDSTTNEFSDNGSTEIKAKVDNFNSNVRAKVPLKVVVVFGGTGASEITGPTASSYAIENIGDGPIKVTNAEITGMNSTFISEAIYEDSDVWYDSNDDEITEGNYLMFTYETAGNKTYLTDGHKLSDAKAKAGKSPNDEAYVEGAKTFSAETLAAKGDKLEIQLGGKAFFKDTISNDQLTDTLCSIKYTITTAAE